MGRVSEYWTIHGLFYGTKTFHDPKEALEYFLECGTSWDSDEITMVEHKVIHRKINKKPAEPDPVIKASDSEEHDMFRESDKSTPRTNP